MKTYLFDDEEYERACGVCIGADFYMMHFFDGELYIGGIKYNGSFTRDFLILTASELDYRYWELFE